MEGKGDIGMLILVLFLVSVIIEIADIIYWEPHFGGHLTLVIFLLAGFVFFQLSDQSFVYAFILALLFSIIAVGCGQIIVWAFSAVIS